MGLTAKQRAAIATIVIGESQGIPHTRYFSNKYSCRWCGRTIGQNDWKNVKKRHKLVEEHENTCKRRDTVPFPTVVSQGTWYGKWMKDPEFVAALENARNQLLEDAIYMARILLKTSTPDAAQELKRQITEGERDHDRRNAAIAILDRADVTTASKEMEPVSYWLRKLHEVGSNEMADDETEKSDV